MALVELKFSDFSVTANLYNSEDFSDVKFVLKNSGVIYAHKNILALHSPVFKAQFKSKMMDSGNVIEIDDEPDAFRLFIEVIYKLRVCCHPKLLVPLYRLIDKYQIEKLKDTVYRTMYSDRENVLFYFASTFKGDDELNHYFLYIISQDFCKLIEMPSFLDLSKKMMSIILNIDSVWKYQVQAFQTLVKWGEKDKTRIADFNELIHLIDYSKIEYSVVFDMYQSSPFLRESIEFKEIMFLYSFQQMEVNGKILIKNEKLKLKTKRSPIKMVFSQPILFPEQSRTVTHHQNSWKTTIGSELKFGIHTWVIRFSNVDIWDGIVVGVCKSDHKLDTHLGSGMGWGYYSGGGRLFSSIATEKSFGEPFTPSDLITVILNLDKGTLAFKKNDKDQGVFFSNITSPICVAVSSNHKCSFEILNPV